MLFGVTGELGGIAPTCRSRGLSWIVDFGQYLPKSDWFEGFFVVMIPLYTEKQILELAAPSPVERCILRRVLVSIFIFLCVLGPLQSSQYGASYLGVVCHCGL